MRRHSSRFETGKHQDYVGWCRQSTRLQIGESLRRSIKPDLLNSDNMPEPAPNMTTGVGVILGTAAYMSPEQAKGKRLDTRTDIWSWGAGEQPFRSETVPGKSCTGSNKHSRISIVFRRSSAGSSNPVLKGFEAQASTHRRRIASARRRSACQARGRISSPSGAAGKVGIPRTTLESKISSLRIDQHQFKRARA